MSKPVSDVTEGVAVTCPDVVTTERSRPEAATVSASCGDRQNALPEGSSDSAPTTGKRISAYPLQRRGSRKKTLSLNPEEREALENLIEEVIMGGVGEGVIDSDASSSDDEEGDEGADGETHPSAQNSLASSSTSATVGDAARQGTFVKGGKKFYPGQLKVALKHMHDLPPRFVRKLAKAQQYLDAGGSMYSKPVVSVGPIEEEEETSAHSKDDSKQLKSAAVATSVLERDRDKSRLKEHKLKDAKKVIRTLLTDRDQYIDETVSTAITRSHSQSHSTCSDSVYSASESISSSQNSQNVAQYRQHEGVSDSVSVCENMISTSAVSSIVTCTSDTQVYHPSIGAHVPNRVAEFVPKMSDTNYRAGQASNLSPSSSRPIPSQPYQTSSLGIPQYQLSMPVVHGMKPAPVLSQSPPGTQFWIPQAMVPSNTAGFYGSSPPVVGMTGVPSAFNQPMPYGYSIQSPYPTAQGVHASYAAQYLYSASPPNQGLVGPPYSAATYSQPVSYPLTVLPPEHYVGPPRAMSANFYQNTPPPGYHPTQSHPASDHTHIYASDVPPATDGMGKQVVSADHTRNLSALSVPVLASYQSPTQLMNCCVDTRSVHTKPVCTVSMGFGTTHSHETSQKSHHVMHPSTRHSSGYHSLDTGANVTPNIRPHKQYSKPDPTSALNSQRPRFSKSPVSAPLPNPCNPKTSISSQNSALSQSVAAGTQCPVAVQPKVSEICTLELPVIDKTTPTPNVEHSDLDLHHASTEPPKSQLTSLSPISDSSVLSNSLLAESGSGDYSYSGGCETKAEQAGCSEEMLEPCSTTLVMMQESSISSAAEEQSEFPCTSCTVTESYVQPVKDLDISGMPVVQSINEHSSGAEVLRGDAGSVMHLTCSSRTGDNSGELLTSIKENRIGSCEDQSTSELQNSVSVIETLNRSSCDQSQFQQLPPNPVFCSKSLPPVTDEVADISLDCDATGVMSSDQSSDLVVTLSSRLISTLAEMFGLPPECDTDHGMRLVSLSCYV